MKVNTSELNSIVSDIDLFICSSGFELRSKSVAYAINSNKIKNAIIFHIDENYILSYENLKEIESKITNLKTIEHPKNNPIETYDIISKELKTFFENNTVGNKFNIVIDVTTFTREVLLILFKSLNQMCYIEKANIHLLYTPAEDYPCEWLTKGIRHIRSIFGYSGMIVPSKKLMLIILNGFENERTEEIIKSFEPNGILLGKPSKEESINSGLNEIGQVKFENIKNKYSSSVIDEFEFSCIEVSKTIEVLVDLIKKYEEEFNIILAPLNNKVSTIAVAMVALKNENVQVCYASANQYNIYEYSNSSNYFLAFEMNEFLD